MSHSSRALPSGQEWFMLPMKKCLYNDTKSFHGEGRCTGVTHTLGRLFLTHKDEAIYPLLQFIHTDVILERASELRSECKMDESLKEKSKKERLKSIPDKNQMRIEAVTFFALTENAQNDDFQFDPEIKEIMKTSKLFSSVDFKRIGGIKNIPSSHFTWSYTIETLTLYFTSLRKVLEGKQDPLTIPFDKRFILKLVNGPHMIGVGYANGKWLFMESEDLELIKKRIDSDQEIALNVFESLRKESVVFIATAVMVGKRHLLQTQNYINEWLQSDEMQKIRAIPPSLYIDEDGSLLSVAVYGGDEKTTEILLNFGMDANETDRDGFTPLLIATDKYYERIVNLLLSYGADPYKEANNGRYPLFVLVEQGNQSLIKIILDRELRAVPETSKDLAKEQKNLEIIKLFELHAKKINILSQIKQINSQEHLDPGCEFFKSVKEAYEMAKHITLTEKNILYLSQMLEQCKKIFLTKKSVAHSKIEKQNIKLFDRRKRSNDDEYTDINNHKRGKQNKGSHQ